MSDAWGVAAAFEGACVLMLASVIYALAALPKLPAIAEPPEAESSTTLTKTIRPFRVLMSTKVPNSEARSFQRPLLTMGVFCGVVGKCCQQAVHAAS